MDRRQYRVYVWISGDGRGRVRTFDAVSSDGLTQALALAHELLTIPAVQYTVITCTAAVGRTRSHR